ncbi:hypothetical protein CCHL11_00595 [Colletotrichum chlorophyti]|uniref:Protein IBD2 n=1 Tax=Colletotrichum chlorophyti TaxID=708187 RepID=A0A1Q8S4P3_9PEZI|nr:hypothetical protein CCHL11_00595 [Colletotrichum chlorophyti]
MSGAFASTGETPELAVAADCIGHAPLKLTGLRLYHSTSTLANLGVSLLEAGPNRKMSPESVSSLFPQRPIRPLPKRRLRERLSPEVADSIEYPPANHNSSPLFYYPHVVRDEAPSRSGAMNGTSRGVAAHESSPKGHMGIGESDEEELALSSSKVVRRSHPEILNRASAMPPKPEHSRHPNPQPPPSTTSSADGYESFENTNNKKKRKIPTAGDSALSGGHSLADLASIGVTTVTSPNEHGDLAGPVSPSYYGAGNFVANNQGISGPGRGRFGRSRNGRSPLRALSDAANNWAGRGAKIRPPQWATSSDNPGIISSAIANAEKIPSAPGQENVSLLHQHSSSVKSNPAATQFTFTCDSPVPKPQWPGTDPTGHGLPSGYGPNNKSKHASMATQINPGSGGATTGANAVASSGKGNTQSGTKKSSRHRFEKELRMADKHRRQEARRKLLQNPPKPEDVWICMFCEYESIFGEPPSALIRQYEIKDREERRKQAERRRLLEKARQKNRKGKKAAKAPGKTAATQNSAQDQGGSVGAPMASAASNSTHDGEFPNNYDHGNYRNDKDDYEEGSYSQDDPSMVLSDDPDDEHDCDCSRCDSSEHQREPDDPGDFELT